MASSRLLFDGAQARSKKRGCQSEIGLGEFGAPPEKRTMMKKYQSERKGRRSLDVAVEYGAAQSLCLSDSALVWVHYIRQSYEGY
jgi:hypothetical protein